jgi:hypothetical protein
MRTFYKAKKWVEITRSNYAFLLRDKWLQMFGSSNFVDDVKVIGDLPKNDNTLILYSSCDDHYFAQYGEALVGSAMKNAPATHVHLHLVDPEPDTLQTLSTWKGNSTRFSYTFERPHLENQTNDFRKCYYASIRFVRIAEVLRQGAGDVLCIDVDSVIRGPIEEVRDLHPMSDIMLRLRPKRKDWRWAILASAVFFRRTANTDSFSLRLSERIKRHLSSLDVRWGIDQQCIYATLRQSNIAASNLPTVFTDFDFAEESYIWTGKGDRKCSDRFRRSLQAH